MHRKVFSLSLVAAALVACWHLAPQEARAIERGRWLGAHRASSYEDGIIANQNSASGLFYNYYVPGAQPAQMYLSPRPTPPLVGHTYITYQPLYPHEFLYKHSRTYYAPYNGARGTKTRVSWW